MGRYKVKNYCRLLVITFLCSIVWVNFSTKLYAQKNKIKFEHLSIEQGLSQNTVFSIVQDTRGFMWFGTEDGLNKYDGYSFTVYKPDPQDLQSLSANTIYSIYEDQTGVLWIGTFGGGLNKFDREKETFTHYKYDPNDPQSLSANTIYSIYEDQTGVLWIGTIGGGLNKFDREKETFTRYKYDLNDPQSLGANTIYSIYEDQSGVLWIGTRGGGLNKFDREKETFTQYKFDLNDPQSLSNNSVSSIYEGRSGALWVGTRSGGLNKFDREKETFTHYKHDPNDPQSLSNNEVISIYEDQSGVLWIGTFDGGLNKFDRGKETFTHYKRDPNDPQSLSDNRVISFFEDQSGALWIGTLGGGLNKFDRRKETFAHYEHDPNDPKSLSQNSVWSIYEDRSGLLWVGTNGGLNQFDRVKETFTHYKYDLNDSQSLSDNSVSSIYEGQSGALWIGTISGLNKFDQEKETFTHYKYDLNDPQSLSDNSVSSIYEDQTGVLWIGTFGGGLNKFNREKETFNRYKYDLNDPQSLSDNSVSSIYEDQTGVLWIGTFGGGLNKFDRDKENFTHYKQDPNDPQSLSDNRVFSIYEDQTGTLWIGTFGGGLNKFGREKETFKQYREKDGLPNDVIYGILEDHNNNLWLSTNKGLSKFNPETEKFRNYDVKDGLQSNEFNAGAYYKSKSGEMFFGGINGFNIFHPDSIKDNPYIPPIVITDFQVFNKSVQIFKGNSSEERPDMLFLDKHISETEEIILTYQESVFSFEFAALDYSLPEKNNYAYMMEGFDKGWNYTNSKKRFATYTNLDPGEYIFRVKGSNNDGVWNEEGISILLTITPPFWKTWWAYSIYSILVLTILFGYVRHKKNELEKEREVSDQLRRVDKLKDEFLANTSHELRTPLNGIIGIAESLIDGTVGDLPEKANSNLSMIAYSGKRLAALVNDILDFSKIKNKDLEIRKQPVDIEVMTEVVLKISEPLLAGKTLLLKNEIPKDIPLIEADENRIQQILYNLIGNAIKFTESGSVTVSALTQNGMVEVSVSDTGIGIAGDKFDQIFQSFEQVDASIAREYGGTGLGLSLTKQLIELHNGTIRVESEVGKGSTFTFTLPKAAIESEAIRDQYRKRFLEQTHRPSIKSVAKVKETEKVVPSDDSFHMKEGHHFNILVVDDDPVNQQVLANHLTAMKYNVEQAFSGEDALRAVDGEKNFDIILLDVMMPRMSGYEVCRRIREKYLESELPVIMITAKDQVVDLVEGFSSGANDYLAKPFSKNELLARIRTHLKLYKINTSYSRFVPHEFLQSLGRESIIDVNLGDHVAKEMTILFSDIRSYSRLSESMSPEDNFRFLNSYLSRVGPLISINHGFVNQFYGDGIMALYLDEPEDAINSAIEMHKEIDSYNNHRKKKGRAPIKIGIGLHTGPIMLGIIGDKKRMDAGVVADSVNTASRMEGLTKYYGASTIISENTLSRIKEPQKFNYRRLGRAQVKGKEKAITVFEFFDGDSKEIKDMKLKTKDEFEGGLNQYFSEEFEKSISSFKKVLKINPGDKTANLYLQRSAYFVVAGVPKEWKGIETIDTK